MRHKVIGKGKVGKTLINSLEKIGERVIESISSVNVVWLAVPESALETVIKEIEKDLSPKHIVVHLSGLYPASILKNSSTEKLVSLHPAFSFSSSYEMFPSDIFWTFQGSSDLFPVFETFIKKWGGSVKEISEKEKPVYHAACVFASNFPVVSLIIAEKLFSDCGVDFQEVFKGLVYPLCEKVKNTQSLEDILTGPAKRGDIETVMKEIEVLKDVDGDISVIYDFLSRFVLQKM